MASLALRRDFRGTPAPRIDHPGDATKLVGEAFGLWRPRGKNAFALLADDTVAQQAALHAAQQAVLHPAQQAMVLAAQQAVRHAAQQGLPHAAQHAVLHAAQQAVLHADLVKPDAVGAVVRAGGRKVGDRQAARILARGRRLNQLEAGTTAPGMQREVRYLDGSRRCVIEFVGPVGASNGALAPFRGPVFRVRSINAVETEPPV